jgi:iron complex transport system permease protein
MSRPFLPGLTAALAALALGLIVAFTVGRYPVSVAELVDVFAARMTGRATTVPPAVENVVLLVRGPRVLAAMLVGAALAIAGTAFQGLFRNPLVSPDILGASSGAALGAVLGIYFSLGVVGIETLAFAGGLIAVAAVYVIGSLLQSRDPVLVLVLTGVVVGALLGAGVGLVKYLADPYNQLPAMTFWLLGSLAATTVADLLPLTAPVAIGSAVLLALRWRLNVMSLPEEEARARARYRAAASGDRRRGNPGDLGERGNLRHHRLGRTGGATSRPRAGLIPTPALLGGGYLLFIDTLARTAAPGGNSARHSHRDHRHAVLHLAARRHAADLVVSLTGCDLTIGYSDRVVGRGLNVALEQGEVLALLGPNGGGKTTLLKTLLGTLKPRAGGVTVGGRALALISLRERAKLIAYVPQLHVPTFAFTVETVVLMGRSAHGNLFSRPSAHDRDVAARVLAQFGIAHLAPRPYTMISGGERQLVLLARALAQEPQFVVLDEPTASLGFGIRAR